MYQIILNGYWQEDNIWNNTDDIILFDSRSEFLQVTEPKCELELNKTGTLSFKIAPTHPYYNLIYKLKSELSLYQDGEWLFTGRVLNDEIDFKNFKVIEVEGELGYLLDTIQRREVYHIPKNEDDLSEAIRNYLTDVLNIHNEQVEDYKQFSVGQVTVQDKTDQLYKISSYDSTLTTLNEDLIDTFKGYLIPRNENGVKYLDYITSNDFKINSQIIQFGKNLIDLKQYIKGEDIATAIIPLGAKVSEITDGDNNIEVKLDLTSLGDEIDGTIYHDAGSDYIYDVEAVAKYGLIYKVLEWDGVTEPSNLLEKAKEQLNFYKLHELKLELNAFDLHLLDANVESFRIGQKVRVISLPHKLNGYLLVTKMDINLSDPSKTTITLSTEERTAKEINSIAKKTNDTNNNVSAVEKDLKNNDYVTGNDLDDKLNSKFDNYTSSDTFKDKLDDYVDSSNFKNSFDNYTKGDGFNSSMKDYMNSDNFKGNMSDLGYSTGGSGGTADLSDYATKEEVNKAFDELASLLGGV